MNRVTGIGGIFIKAKDADALREWYRKHLGLDIQGWGGVTFHWHTPDRPNENGTTIWSVFEETSDYFDPSKARFMVNYRVDDLAAVLKECGRRDARWTRSRRNRNLGSLAGSWIAKETGWNCGNRRRDPFLPRQKKTAACGCPRRRLNDWPNESSSRGRVTAAATCVHPTRFWRGLWPGGPWGCSPAGRTLSGIPACC